MRSGEVKRLMWINIDLEKNMITHKQPGERQQPKNVEGFIIAYCNAKRHAKNQRKSVRRKQLALDEKHLHKKPKKTGLETSKPEATTDNFPHVQTLESPNLFTIRRKTPIMSRTSSVTNR